MPAQAKYENYKIMSVMEVAILFFTVTDCKNRLSYGRARRPAPTRSVKTYGCAKSQKSSVPPTPLEEREKVILLVKCDKRQILFVI